MILSGEFHVSCDGTICLICSTSVHQNFSGSSPSDTEIAENMRKPVVGQHMNPGTFTPRHGPEQ